MKIRERMLECKVRHGIKSDYKLADHLGCTRQRVSEVMSGKCKSDAYLAVRIGESLGIHPLILLAEFEAEQAKSDERKAFWINFRQRIKQGVLPMLALISIASLWPVHGAHAAGLDTHNA